jgi:hypothetical protein
MSIHGLPTRESDLSLDEILHYFDAHDAGIQPLADEELTILSDKLTKKIDACRFIMDRWQAEADQHGKYAKEHTDAKQALENKITRFKERLVWIMRLRGVSSLAGNEFKLALRKTESVDVLLDANEETKNIYPELIRTNYVWDKITIKNALKQGKELSFAKLKESNYPIFTVKKG